MSGQPSNQQRNIWLPWLQAAMIALAAVWIYWAALWGDWMRDDSFDVTANSVTQSPTGLWTIWFAPGSQLDYYPIKASVQWFQWHLWGIDPFGYHATNLLLHIASAWLVWRLLAKFGLRLAWLGGLIFAVHPMMVESVAWIAELKNTLSLPPFLLAMGAWIDYENRSQKRDYRLAVALFTAAMLCKISMAPFPLVILLYAWWKRSRITRNDLKASAPFFAIAVALVLINMWSGATYRDIHGAIEDEVPLGGIFSRLAVAGLSISFYFAKCFWPVPPLPLYPQWVVDPPSLAQFLPWPVMAAVAWWLWTKRQDWSRHALFGLGFFVLMLAPSLGFISISYMNASWVMDHFLYIPIIGLIGLVVAGLNHLNTLLPSFARTVGIGLLALVLASMAWASHAYAGMFASEETLWNYQIEKTPHSWMAHINLGLLDYQTDRLPEALNQFYGVLRSNSASVEASVEAHTDIGTTFVKQGRNAEAIDEFKIAVHVDPRHASAYNDWGGVLLRLGRFPEAIDQFEQALRLYPNYGSPHANLASAFLQTGRFEEAVAEGEKALISHPENLSTQATMADALVRLGRFPEAIEHYKIVLRANPDNAQVHNNLGIALNQMGNIDEALGQFQAALELVPDYPEARGNLAFVLEKNGRIPDAVTEYQAVLRLHPNDVAAKTGLARLQKTR